MNLRIEKNMHILTEIVSCFYKFGAHDVNIDISIHNNYSTLVVKGEIESIEKQNINYMTKTLNIKRQHDVEEYYWNISGDCFSGNQLGLVGMMVDEAAVDYVDKMLTVTTKRIED